VIRTSARLRRLLGNVLITFDIYPQARQSLLAAAEARAWLPLGAGLANKGPLNRGMGRPLISRLCPRWAEAAVGNGTSGARVLVPMHAHPRGAVLATLIVLLSACSSKNPDALTAVNVDENLAIMDANADATNVSGVNAVSSRDANDHTGRSGNATERHDEPSAEVNAVGTSSSTSTDQEGADNQVGNEEEPPKRQP